MFKKRREAKAAKEAAEQERRDTYFREQREMRERRSKPNAVTNMGKQLIIEERFDLGRYYDTQLMMVGNRERPVVVLHDGRIAELTTGVGMNDRGWSATRIIETGETGPRLTVEGGRLIQTERYGYGNGFCPLIDELRSQLDEKTGEPIIEAA